MKLNILDITEKKKVLMEYRLRLAVITVFAIGVIALASLLVLLPSYILAVSKFNNTQKEVAALEAKNGDGAQEKEIGTRIRAINDEVTLLTASSDATIKIPLPAQVIQNILKIKTPQIKITTITYDAGAAQQKVVVVGVAATRDSLATFVDDLKKDTTYSSVTLPISSYVKSANIDFSIVLDAKQKVVEKRAPNPIPR